MGRLSGKHALVIGGGRGLGRAIALAFAAEGEDAAIASRTRPQLEEVAQSIRSLGQKAFPLEVDVRQSGSVTDMVAAALTSLGRIDILVNSAGVGWTQALVDTADETWDWILETNLNGTFYACREVAKHMRDRGAGNIINIASVAGIKGPPGLGAYAASKGAVIALTKTLALEMARFGVRVNAIAPGYFRTEMNAVALDDPSVGPKIVRRIPLRRVGRPEEIGPLAVYLASEESAFATGEVFCLSGGEMAM
jgi:2-deoxy-D-gluconate 3-dehydrogenase